MSQSRQMKAYVPLHVLAVAQTDVGRTRDHNEDVVGIAIPGGPVRMYTNEGLIELPAVGDAAALRAKGALFLVADGMGGYQAGEVASDLATRTIIHEYYADPNDTIAESLRRALSKANAAVYAWGQASAQRKGMGTTVAAAVVRGAETHIAWVGDSRIYLLRNGVLQQSTEDHSFVNDLVRTGVLSQEEARNHPQKNVVTRALGHRPDVEVDSRATQLQPDDRLLICSDGLSGPVADPQLEAILKQHPPEDAVPRLVQAANIGGGPDNISVIALAAQPYSGAGPLVEERRPTAPAPAPTTPPPPTAPPPTTRSTPWLKGGSAAIILVVLAALLVGAWRLLSTPRNGANATVTPTVAQTLVGPTATVKVISGATATLAATSPEPTSTLSPLKPTSTVQPPTPTPEATWTPAPTPTPRCERRPPELVRPAPDATHYSGENVRYEWQGGQLCAGDQWRVSFYGNGRQEQLLTNASSVEWSLNVDPAVYTWIVDMVDETGTVVQGMSSSARTINFKTASGGQPACDPSKDGDGDGVSDCDDKCPAESAPGTSDGCRQ